MEASEEKTSAQRLNLLKSRIMPNLAMSVGLGLASGILLIAQALILAGVVHEVIVSGSDPGRVMPRLIWLPLLMIARAVLSWWGERVAFNASAAIRFDLRNELFRRIIDAGPLALRGKQAGDAATVVVDGIEALEGYYARYLPHLGIMALVPLAILAAVLPADPISAAVMLFSAPFIPLFTILIGKGAERLNQRQWQTLARLGGYFLDRVNGLATLRMFNASRREAELIAKISDEYRRTTLSVLYLAFLSALALEFFATVSLAVMAVIIGFRLLKGGMTFQDGFTVLLLAPEFYLPLRMMGSYYHARMEALGAAERIFALLDLPLLTLPENPLPLPCNAPPAIVFDAVTFRYAPDAPPALNQADFAIAPGERVAIVGPSGSGKSTIISLLLGFADIQQGKILIDGNDLSRCDRRDWHRHVTWVPQRPGIFHGTIEDNIRLGRENATDTEVLLAAERARCLPFITRLPGGGGMNCMVGENGAGLSGGEAQRLALARAFLKDTPLVILDEPTAGLDSASEYLVREALNELAVGRTMITVAHRLSNISDAGRVIVIFQGSVLEQGSYGELEASGGMFSQMLAAGEVLP